MSTPWWCRFWWLDHVNDYLTFSISVRVFLLLQIGNFREWWESVFTTSATSPPACYSPDTKLNDTLGNLLCPFPILFCSLVLHIIWDYSYYLSPVEILSTLRITTFFAVSIPLGRLFPSFSTNRASLIGLFRSCGSCPCLSPACTKYLLSFTGLLLDYENKFSGLTRSHFCHLTSSIECV